MMMSALTGLGGKPAASTDALGTAKSGSNKQSQPDDNPFALLMAALQISVNPAQQPLKLPSSTSSTGKSDTASMTNGADYGYAKPSMLQPSVTTASQQSVKPLLSAPSTQASDKSSLTLGSDHGYGKPSKVQGILNLSNQFVLKPWPRVISEQTIAGAETIPRVQVTPRVATMAQSQASFSVSSLGNASASVLMSDAVSQVKTQLSGVQSSRSSQPGNADAVPSSFVRMLDSAGISSDDIRRITITSTVGRAQGIEPPRHPTQMDPLTADSTGSGLNTKAVEPRVRRPNQGDLLSSSILENQSTGAPSPTVNAYEDSPKTAEWSMLDDDANQKFGSLLAAHASSSTGSQTLTVQVHPQGLGSLTVTVAHSEAGLSLQIQASNVQTAQWLQTETGRLTQAVESAGLPVSGLQVSVSGGNSDERRGQSQGSETRRIVAKSNNTGTAADDSVGLSAFVQGVDGMAQAISVRA